MYKNSITTLRNLISLITILAMLSGCYDNTKVAIISALNQADANKAILILGDNKIDADKVVDTDGNYTVMVAKSSKLAALNLLTTNGIPNEKFTNLGQVFKKDSFISTPREEHSRFLYALDQEISSLLSAINGVVEVKTIVNIPQSNDNLWKSDLPQPSASVLVKYQRGSRVSLYIPRIKALVSNAVPGLTPDKVEVITMQQKDE